LLLQGRKILERKNANLNGRMRKGHFTVFTRQRPRCSANAQIIQSLIRWLKKLKDERKLQGIQTCSHI